MPFGPFNTRRDYYAEFTSDNTIVDQLDAIADRNELGVFGAHTAKDEVSPEDVRTMLERIDERGIEAMTLREAIERFGHR